jgi:NTP pyrophosphatase (non-canonical NTP hydrolase)
MDHLTFLRVQATLPLDTKNAVELALKTSEETGELAEAVLSVTGAPGNAYKEKNEMDVLEEAADVMICAVATLLRIIPEITYEELLEMLDKKIRKWGLKCKENPRVE